MQILQAYGKLSVTILKKSRAKLNFNCCNTCTGTSFLEHYQWTVLIAARQPFKRQCCDRTALLTINGWQRWPLSVNVSSVSFTIQFALILTLTLSRVNMLLGSFGHKDLRIPPSILIQSPALLGVSSVCYPLLVISDDAIKLILLLESTQIHGRTQHVRRI